MKDFLYKYWKFSVIYQSSTKQIQESVSLKAQIAFLKSIFTKRRNYLYYYEQYNVTSMF